MQRSSRAGGCFLTLFILLGFLGGLAIRNPLKGMLIGLGIGVVLAILTWLIDPGAADSSAAALRAATFAHRLPAARGQLQ